MIPWSATFTRHLEGAETIAGVRAHWDGLFQFGVDVAVVNVTKDAIWYRKASTPNWWWV